MKQVNGARCRVEGVMASEEKNEAGRDQGFYSPCRFLVSFRTMRQQFSSFFTSVLSKTLSKQKFLLALITS